MAGRLLVLGAMVSLLVTTWPATGAHATASSFVWLSDSLGDGPNSCPPSGTPGFCGAPVYSGARVTFSVLVGPQGAVPTGTVEFHNALGDGSAVLRVVPLDGQGRASFTVTITGLLTVFARYSGDATYSGSDSGPVTVRVSPPGTGYGPNASGFALDGYGGLYPWALGWWPLPVPPRGPHWPGWNIARGLAIAASVSCSIELDGFGGLHTLTWPAGPLPKAVGAPYWRGWDIARDVTLMPDCSGGYVLDGWGGLHPFSFGGPLPRPVTSGPYWRGWDIARGVVVRADGTGGYVIDGFGGVHPFGLGGRPAPARPTTAVYFAGRDIIRGASLLNREGILLVDKSGETYTDALDDTAPSANPGGVRFPANPIANGIAAFGNS